MTSNTISDAVTMAGGEGTLLANRYRIVKQLGQGGMGSVWLAEDTQLDNKPFAIKMLPSILVSNKRAYRQLKDEALVAMKLTHPNIVTLRAFEENNGNPFLVMDYIDGQTLDDYLAEVGNGEWGTADAKAVAVESGNGGRGGLPEAEVIRILKPIAAALDYAHSKGVVHRDVKPGNVMIAKDGTPFILDFGIAREIQETMTRVTGKLSSGTLLYMSPEQLRGLPPKPSQDVYSFAAMMYECLSGNPPFYRGAIEDQIKNEEPPTLVGASVPLARSVMSGLAKKPDDRPRTCAAVVACGCIQRRATESQSCMARTQCLPPRKEDSGRKEREGSKGVGKTIAVLALLAALGGGVWWTVDEKGMNGTTETARITNAPSVSSVPSVLSVPVVSDSQQPTNDSSRAAAEVASRQAEEANAHELAAEFIRLKTRITIKRADAKHKMDAIAGFREDQDGLEDHIKSAYSEWNTLSALPAPETFEEAQAAFEIADRAEAQIALDLDWLTKNKTGRDAAKAAKSEVAALLAGDITMFKAGRNAPAAFREGEELREAADAAFETGDFGEAGRLMGEAKAKYVAAAQDAKSFFIKTTLESAKTYFDAAKWDDCIAECGKVLGWDVANIEAKNLKSDAEEHLVPSVTFVAKIGDREIRGAKIKVGGRDYLSPFTRERLETGDSIGPFKVTYSENGKRYEGSFKAIMVDWRGPKSYTFLLEEYSGPKDGDCRTMILPGLVKMDMVYVAPGSFRMGSGTEWAQTHDVRISKGFWIGKYPVTQFQWAALVRANGISFAGKNPEPYFSSTGGGSNHVSGMNTSEFPMEGISWKDCDTLVKALNTNATDGRIYSIPTEAQWEFAARGGNKSRNYVYSGGNDMDSIGWYYENSGQSRLSDSEWKVDKLSSNRCRTHSVREKDVGNELGIVGMSGNVWEWCQDLYDVKYYSKSPGCDPCNTASGLCRVMRGGGWSSGERFCRSVFRDRSVPDLRSDDYGFRLCCSAEEVAISEETTIHTVQRGDYLAKISKKYNVPISLIKRLNPELESDNLRIGQKLKIPVMTSAQ